MIIGVTGYTCAGKDSFARILQDRGFGHISLSDMIRDEIRARGLDVTHERTVEVGNELRRNHGPQVLAELALQRMDPGRNYVVTSIRSPGEAAALRRRPDFTLVFIDAEPRTRYERMAARGRADDLGSFEEFLAAERRQLESDDPAAQQLNAVRDAADLHVQNDAALEELEKKALEILRTLELSQSSPLHGGDAPA